MLFSAGNPKRAGSSENMLSTRVVGLDRKASLDSHNGSVFPDPESQVKVRSNIYPTFTCFTKDNVTCYTDG